MRLDKYLKVSRLIKRRTVANEACDAGRVVINGKVAKASADVKAGDVIEIAFGNKSVKVMRRHARPARSTSTATSTSPWRTWNATAFRPASRWRRAFWNPTAA